VPITQFCEAFSKDVKKLTKTQINCFQKISAEIVGQEDLIDIERFSNLLKWFGVMKVDATLTLADRIEAVLKQPWFFGDIDAIAAQNKVQATGTPGAFLVRFNLGSGTPIEKAPYNITTATSTGSFHTRCYKRSDHVGLIVEVKKGEETIKIATKSTNIEDLINDIQRQDKSVCGTPVSGSPFASIFVEKQVEKSAYNGSPDD